MSEKNWIALGYLAVVVAACMLAASFAFPIKSAGAVVATRAQEDRNLDASIETLRTEVSTLRAKNLMRLWTQPADEVAAATMAKVTSLAQGRNLKVIAFRPQRTVDDAGVVRLPYQVTLEGPFPQVIGFLQGLETSKFRAIVSTVQIASSDGATDKVTATIGVVAYREADAEKK
ncbi:MAG: type 4a pilus biogenesis protein PilO [Methanoregulaceae archaeon]|nr:type 4a pilus biogenesis protein PilO [Methanoregulaceae archaeon]